MKKYILFGLISIFLVGCQKGEGDIKAIPDEKPEEFVDTRPLYESNTKPRLLDLRRIGDTNWVMEASYYCWAKESIEDECMTKLNDVHIAKLADLREYPSPIGYPIEFYFGSHFLDLKDSMPVPDYSELYIYNDDGTFTPVEIIDNKFNLPEEEGVYTLVFKAIYDGEHKGITFYTFKLFARYMDLSEHE